MSFSRAVAAQSDDLQQLSAADLLSWLRAHQSSAGVALSASAWLVTAYRPAE